MAYTGSETPKSLRSIAFGSPVNDVLEIVAEDGGVILEGLLSADEVDQLNGEVDGIVAAHHTGTLKDDPRAIEFFGNRTKRITNLIYLSKTYRERVVDNDHVHAYVSEMFRDVCDQYWLASSQLIEIHPGETRQPLHRDMGNFPVFFRMGPQGPEVIVNIIVALSDCTEEAGATRVIPGSHKWEFSEGGSPEQTVPAVMKAGSAFLFGGKVIHGGGANVTADVKRRVVCAPFNPSFLVPEEPYPLVIPLEEARKMSPRVQQLTGFRSFHQQGAGSLWQHNFEELALHLKL